MSTTICLHDTAVFSSNLGDQIIMDAVRNELRDAFPDAYLINAPTHDYLGKESLKRFAEARFSIVGGTNLLSGNMNHYNQWKINLFTSRKIKHAVLMGVGWWQYQDKVNRYTQSLLKRVLSNQFVHSVRDTYTERKLRSIGLNNVVTTGCPTMWRLDEQHCQAIPTHPAEEAVVTITDYKPNQKSDQALLDLVGRHYRKVYVWLQGEGDAGYLKPWINKSVELIMPSLSHYDRLLADPNRSLDYVGTRLHAGIRALQHHRRATILSVDNRATEIGHDFGLPVVDRTDLNAIEEKITSDFPTQISMPLTRIHEWKHQFANAHSSARK